VFNLIFLSILGRFFVRCMNAFQFYELQQQRIDRYNEGTAGH